MKPVIKSINIALIIVIGILFALFLIRFFSPSEIDDVSPMIDCPEIEKYDPDVLWVIPKYKNISISENTEWCKYILSLNKTLQLHAYEHSYLEFENKISEEQIKESIGIFEECFGLKPTKFKPPQLKISPENEILLKKEGLVVRKRLNQIFHKVYHCDDSGLFSNKLISLF